MTALSYGLKWPLRVQHFATNNENDSNMRDTVIVCSEIEGLTVDSRPETTGVTTFDNEACTMVMALGLKNTTASVYQHEPSIQDLTKYFARPVALSDALIPLGTRNRFYSLAIRMAGLANNWMNGLARLNGVHGFRATAVFTLQVAATPFHQGTVCLSFQHGCDPVANDVFIRSTHVSTVQNLPHVTLDISTDTMVQLKVPYIYTNEYSLVRDYATDEPTYGLVALNNVLTTPSVTGLVAPGYQLLVHLEDLELFGATPQASTAITLQAGKHLAPIVEEFEKESHPFSSATMALSRTVGWISKGIPAISSIGGPTSWFLAKAAGAIRSFGFAKPTIVEPAGRMNAIDSVMEQNIDVASGNLVVGPFASNCLRVSPLFGGTDIDEMSMNYILSQWSVINIVPFDTSAASRAVLFATPVSPSCCWYRRSAAPSFNTFAPVEALTGTNSFQPSSLFFASSMFRYWRGSIKYRFTFGKSKMHGGRVMVCYNPYIQNVADASAYGPVRTTLEVADYGTNGPSPFGYSKMFNLRDSNVLEFDVPYTTAIPYLTFPNISGSLVMYVVDPLQAPATVANSVDILVEVCGGDDFELADPIGPRYPNHPLGTIRTQAGRWVKLDDCIELQSGKTLSSAPEHVSEFTIGESVNSLKQLIMIPKVTYSFGGAVTGLFDIQPWYYQPMPSVLTPAAAAHLSESFGYGGNIAGCYAFVKGGTDFHAYTAGFQSAGTSTGDSTLTVSQGPTNRNLTYSTTTPARGTDSSMPMVISQSGNVHVRLPAYQKVVRLVSHAINSVFPSGQSWGMNANRAVGATTWSDQAPQALYNLLIAEGETAIDLWSSRAAADDAGCALYLGPPPMALLVSSTAAGRYDPDAVFP
jgi:hypothetical protein